MDKMNRKDAMLKAMRRYGGRFISQDLFEVYLAFYEYIGDTKAADDIRKNMEEMRKFPQIGAWLYMDLADYLHKTYGSQMLRVLRSLANDGKVYGSWIGCREGGTKDGLATKYRVYTTYE